MSVFSEFNTDVYKGFDPRNYAPIGTDGQFTVATANAYTTLLDVIGEGFIDLAILGISYSRILKITIDGVVKTFSGDALASTTGFSISGKHDASYAATSTMANELVKCGVGSFSASQLTTGYSMDQSSFAGVAESVVPIFFKASLKIEGTTATAGGVLKYSIRGGLKI